jgi:hypothetical protein
MGPEQAIVSPVIIRADIGRRKIRRDGIDASAATGSSGGKNNGKHQQESRRIKKAGTLIHENLST